ncbi:MAG TPA: hypothetical protein VF794_14855 [Archangium sp.]|jgi:hypothetical protein|uniref:GspE/PulE/PilB domain-containing protein n=1 Tax=Archangium sp. TaxID=1872627 RepID=UPI002ED77201
MARKRIGELLLERGAITPAQLEAALQVQQQTQKRLGAALVSLGAITERTLAHALSEALGVPVIDLANRPPDWSAIHLLRPRFCEQHELFPVALESVGGRKVLVVAMADPLDSTAVQEMEFTTGLKVSTRVAPLSAVRAALQRYYQPRPAPGSAPAAGGPPVLAPTPASEPLPSAQEDDVEEIIVGQELPQGESTRRVSLEQLIQEREEQHRRKRGQVKPSSVKRAADLSADLDSLFGAAPGPTEPLDPVEELERKFWALMRIMARKGLLTKEEFTQELDDES